MFIQEGTTDVFYGCGITNTKISLILETFDSSAILAFKKKDAGAYTLMSMFSLYKNIF